MKDAVELVGGNMDDQLSEENMEKIIDWIGIKDVLPSERPVRRGDFYRELRATRNFQQWKSIVRRMLNLSPSEADAYISRSDLFRTLLDSSPFNDSLPFR